jgi:hypothetical protein
VAEEVGTKCFSILSLHWFVVVSPHCPTNLYRWLTKTFHLRKSFLEYYVSHQAIYALPHHSKDKCQYYSKNIWTWFLSLQYWVELWSSLLFWIALLSMNRLWLCLHHRIRGDKSTCIVLFFMPRMVLDWWMWWRTPFGRLICKRGWPHNSTRINEHTPVV